MPPSGGRGEPAPAGGLSSGDAPTIFFSVLPKRKRAVHGPKEKAALVATLHACAKLLYGGRREIVPACLRGLFDGRGGVPTDLAADSRGGVRLRSGCKTTFDQLLFYCLALRRSQYFRHQCSTGSSFRAFRCATRCPGSCGGLCWRADESVRPYWACGLRHPRKGRHADRPPQKMHRADGISVGAEALIGPLHRLLRGAASGSEKSRKSMRRPPQRGRHHLPRDGSHRNRRR